MVYKSDAVRRPDWGIGSVNLSQNLASWVFLTDRDEQPESLIAHGHSEVSLRGSRPL